MTTVFIFVNVELIHQTEIAKQIRKIPECVKVVNVTGAYDLIVELNADAERIREIVAWKIKKILAVRSLYSLVTSSSWVSK